MAQGEAAKPLWEREVELLRPYRNNWTLAFSSSQQAKPDQPPLDQLPLEAEPVLIEDGKSSDTALHQPMLENEAANKLSDASAIRIGLEMGLDPEILKTLIAGSD